MDHILLETTGLADPAPLVSILWLDEQLESSIRLDSIITVSNLSVFLVCSFVNGHFMKKTKWYW
jgi:G3E family GTPase